MRQVNSPGRKVPTAAGRSLGGSCGSWPIQPLDALLLTPRQAARSEGGRPSRLVRASVLGKTVGKCGAPVVRPTPSDPTDHALDHHRCSNRSHLRKNPLRQMARSRSSHELGRACHRRVLGLDVRDADDRVKVKAALNTWIVTGKLRVVTAKDEKSFFKQFVEVAAV